MSYNKHATQIVSDPMRPSSPTAALYRRVLRRGHRCRRPQACLGIIRQRRLLQLQNYRTHARYIATGFTRFRIEITQFRDALPLGAWLNLGGFGHELFFSIS